MKSVKKISIAIFFHEHINPHERKYWIGVRSKDGSCRRVIKVMDNKGAMALKNAIQYLKTL